MLLPTLCSGTGRGSIGKSYPVLVFKAGQLGGALTFSVRSSRFRRMTQAATITGTLVGSFSRQRPGTSVQTVLVSSLSADRRALSAGRILPVQQNRVGVMFAPCMGFTFEHSISSLQSIGRSPSAQAPGAGKTSLLFLVVAALFCAVRRVFYGSDGGGRVGRNYFGRDYLGLTAFCRGCCWSASCKWCRRRLGKTVLGAQAG